MGFILKDWYGKEQVFNQDKIFVKDENGELVQFTQGTGESVLESLEVTENGTYTPPDGVDGYNPVTVNVPAPEITLQDKTITENGTYTADSGYDGLGSVTVEIPVSSGGSLVAQCIEFTATGTNQTISHNLGVKPFCAFVSNRASYAVGSLVNDLILAAIGFDQELADLMNNPEYIQRGASMYVYSSTKTPSVIFKSDPIESTATGAVFSKATDTSIKIGGSRYVLSSGTSYMVYLLGIKSN